jgi:hypothetical protein
MIGEHIGKRVRAIWENSDAAALHAVRMGWQIKRLHLRICKAPAHTTENIVHNYHTGTKETYRAPAMMDTSSD